MKGWFLDRRKIAIAYDAQALTGDAASRDVLDQMEAVEKTLHSLGAKSVRIGADLDLDAFKKNLTTFAPSLVFNLVESLDGSDRLQSVIPMLLESWRIPFTGSGSAAMTLSNHKTEAKTRLAAAGLSTPACAWLDAHGQLRRLPVTERIAWTGDAIVKTLDSHASLFIDDSSVLRTPTVETLTEKLRLLTSRHGMPFFAEEYIDGREFNISVVETENGAEVMPPAEITFGNLPPGKPRIVGYAAKWDEDSTEYRGTPRSFDFAPENRPLLESLRELSLRTWEALGLAGYARVDFRVDSSGQPYILEANANPCLSPDAGLAAAVEWAGHDFSWLVRRIAEAAIRRFA